MELCPLGRRPGGHARVGKDAGESGDGLGVADVVDCGVCVGLYGDGGESEIGRGKFEGGAVGGREGGLEERYRIPARPKGPNGSERKRGN